MIAYWHTCMKRDIHVCFVNKEPKRRRRYLHRVWRIYTTTIAQHNMLYATTFLLHICQWDICIDCFSSGFSYFAIYIGLSSSITVWIYSLHLTRVFPSSISTLLLIFLSTFAMHSLASESRPRLSEEKREWLVFETSCYVFGGRISRFAKLNVNKVNTVLLHRINFVWTYHYENQEYISSFFTLARSELSDCFFFDAVVVI